MRADDNAKVADGDLAHVRERGANFIAHVLGVGKAVGIENMHRKALGVDLLEVVFNAAQDLCERSLSAAYLLGNVECAAVGHVQNGLDREERADQRRGVGNAAAGLEVVEIVHGEAVGDLELVRFAPRNDLVIVHALFHARDHALDQKAEAAGDAERVHHIDLAVGVLFARHLRAEQRLFIGYGHLLGHIEEDDVLAGIEQGIEEVAVDIFVDHGGLEQISVVAHALIYGSARFLAAIVFIQLVADRVAVADEGNVVLFQIVPREIRGGRCGDDIVWHSTNPFPSDDGNHFEEHFKASIKNFAAYVNSNILDVRFGEMQYCSESHTGAELCSM